MVAEINRGPKFLDASLANTPLILAQNVLFGKLLTVPMLCINVLARVPLW